MANDIFRFNDEGELELDSEVIGELTSFKGYLDLAKSASIGKSKEQTKIKALAELKYIWLIVNPHSPLSELGGTVLEEEARYQSGLSEIARWKPTKAFTELIEKYKLYTYTRKRRLLTSARMSLDNLQYYFETIDFTKASAQEINAYTATLKNLGLLIKNIEDLEKSVDSESKSSGDVYGDETPGLFD